MKRTFKNFRNFIGITFFVEILLIATFCIFYFVPLFNFNEYVTLPMIVSVMSVLIIFNLLIIWLFYIKFNKMRTTSDLKAADLIGGDVQEAYNFGKIGLVVVDENNTILWINEVFKDRGFDIIDQNIFEWQPKLKELETASLDETIQLEISSRNYDVKYLPDAGLFIFKDSTEYEQIYKLSNDRATVVGIIMIDNYSDISGINDDASDTVSKVRNAIFEYTKKFKVLIRRYRNDAYFMLCDHASLEEMELDKFSLLETVHALKEKDEVTPTLSIGIAHNFPDVMKLNEMASNAIDIALSRGGDQVVVSKYGDDIAFYGGKNEAIETRNKAEVRSIANSLIETINRSSNVFVMGHKESDMDSIGAALGIKAICDHLNKDCHVVYDPKSIEAKAADAIRDTFNSREEKHKIFYAPSEALNEIDPKTLLVVVDCHKPSMTNCQDLLEKVSTIVVIDHHRRGEEFIESPVLSVIDSSASSAAEIITEFIHYCSQNPKIDIPPKYATLMLSGIFLDTQFFKSKTCGIRTFEASMILKSFGADNAKADRFLQADYKENQIISEMIANSTLPKTGVACCVFDEDQPIAVSILAKTANACVQTSDIRASFAIGKTGDGVTHISCRSDGTVNVSIIAEKLGGGGSFASAAVKMPEVSAQVAKDRLLEVLDQYYDDACNTEI